MQKIILVAETGSDIPKDLAQRQGIYLVPMHVTMGEKTLDDGAFPSEEICAHYDRTGELPKTSGSTPEDFAKIFAEIRAEHPQAEILHLAYSAATTMSYQSAKVAAKDLAGIVSLDTKHVSAGQAAIVTTLAAFLQEHPETTMDQALEKVQDLCRRARMCFVPDDLEYLRAGGRISNVVYYLGGRLLHLHPRVEVLDGKLVATKKYRGKLRKVVAELIQDYAQENRLDRACLWLLYTVGLPQEIRQLAEDTARACGFAEIRWLKAQGVITTHGGPSAIAVAGFAQK